MNFTEITTGSTITVADIEFIVLEKNNDSVVCLTKNFIYEDTIFDRDSNNYAESELRKRLNNEFLPKLADAIGKENILETEIDLTSDDGFDDYGKVKDRVGLLTCDQYRKYNRIIEKFPVNDWWWLATPYSTPHRGYHSFVRCVNYGGSVNDYCCSFISGVRPFCIFSSAIFES